VVAFSRIGSSINFAITPPLALIGVPFSVWFGTVMCFLSLIACLYLAFLDWYGEARIKPREKEVISIMHVREFSIQSWLIFLICVLFYVSVLTFYTVASDIMQNTGQQFSAETATFFLFIPNFVAIPASPLFGLFIDKKGLSLFWLLLASAMQICSHMVFFAMTAGWFQIYPAYIMVWIGIAYSMFAASIWPLLPFVIRDPLLGTGYGMMTSIQNAGLALFPQAIGAIQVASAIKDTNLKYIIPIIIFICCAATSLVLTVVLWGIDLKLTGGILNKDGKQKEVYKDETINAAVVHVYN